MADFGYAVRDRDARQTATIVERARSDFFQSIWQVNIYKRRAFGKRITSDFGYSIWEHDADQATAIFERLLANERHAFRYSNARQAIATKKGTFADPRDAARNSDAGQIAALEERLITDARDFLLVIYRRDFGVGVGAGSDSGNGAGSVSVGHELQTFRAFVQGCSGGKDSSGFHGVNPFFPWRSSLGVMPYALGVTISAGTVLCVFHPGLEPAMAALRGMVRFLTMPIQGCGVNGLSPSVLRLVWSYLC